MKFIQKHRGVALSLLALVLLYLSGLLIFSMVSFPKTTVNGKAAALQSRSTLLEKPISTEPYVLQGRKGHKLTMTEQELNFRYRLERVQKPAERLWAWPIEVFRSHPYRAEYRVKFDEEKLKEKIARSALLEGQEAPEDAKLVISAKGAEIVPEKEGNRLSEANLRKAISEAFLREERLVTLDSYYDAPQRRAKDSALVRAKEEANRLLGSHVVFDFKDRSYELTPAALAEMIAYTKEGKVALQQDQVRSWVARMAQETDTYGKPRKFKATGLGEITVPGGIYGWQISVNATTKKLRECLQKGGDHKIDPIYRIRGSRREKDDIGSTYVEVDISRQHLWAYKDGKLLTQGDVVTGMVNKENETPVGVNVIWSREKDRILRGQIINSTKKYETPVSYWMPVNWGGVGLHDAGWRKQFGGTIYKGNGSNGCINCPPDLAKTLFENFTTGTPVVIYESSSSDSPQEKI